MGIRRTTLATPSPIRTARTEEDQTMTLDFKKLIVNLVER